MVSPHVGTVILSQAMQSPFYHNELILMSFLAIRPLAIAKIIELRIASGKRRKKEKGAQRANSRRHSAWIKMSMKRCMHKR